MKRCDYCGAENADTATHCIRCGLPGLVIFAPQVTEAPKGSKLRVFCFRVFTVIGVWLVVTGVSLYVAWGNIYDAHAARIEQSATQSGLRDMEEAIETYHHQFGRDPRSVEDLLKMTNESVLYLSSKPVDGWNRPFVFSWDGSNFLVTSYGRDGKPGGRGLDCDLTSKDRSPIAARPTLTQFLFEMDLNGLIMTCVACGGIAGLLTLLTVRTPHISRTGWGFIAWRLVMTTAAAIFVAGVISVLHIPNGH